MKRTLLYLLLLPGLLSGTCLLAAGSAGNAGHGAKPCLRRLTCEGLTDPLAIDTATPRFGWQLRSGRRGDAQRSYRIEVASDSLQLLAGDADLWDSGWVRSKRSVGVAYEGLPLTARTQCWWRVTARTEKGNRKAVSPVARFGIGLTDPASVSGEFIGCAKSGATAVLLRRAFTLPACGDEALLHVNSLGYHEIWVNGRKVGDACLAPALSQLDKRSLWVTYDVRPYLLEGDNELVIWLGQGWYKRGTFGRWQPDEPYTEPLVRAQLDIGTANTWQTACRTDTAWRAALSGYRDTGSWNALDFGGEEIDARRNPRSMSPSDLDALAWQPVITARKPGHRATPQMVEPDRIQERLTARVLDETAPGVWRIDFGKVVTGWLEAHFSGLPDGARVEIEYSDETDGDGNLIDQRQRDTYIARGDGRERFCNKFNHHAFRYAEVRGLAQRPRREDFRALAIHTDYRPEATFTSSDSDLNAIHDMIAHTLHCLAYNGYMVDCPHLERAGYGGDGNSSTEILQTLCGAAPLYRNWVQAWDDAMRPGGSLPHVAPNAGAGGGGPYWCGFIVMAPWQTWLNYGDRTLVDRHYPAMREWMGYVERYMKDGLLTRWPDTPYRDWFLGDWLAPHGVDTGSEASVSLVNNCFVSDCYARMAQMARLTGHDDEAAAFEARHEALNRTIHARFYDPATHTYATGSQLDMTYPMLVGATPDSLRAGVEQRLFRSTHDVMKDHIGGGLVGVPVITRWAVRSHNPEFIYRMLKQRGYPGYLHMIDHGATATWEYWSVGVAPRGVVGGRAQPRAQLLQRHRHVVLPGPRRPAHGQQPPRLRACIHRPPDSRRGRVVPDQQGNPLWPDRPGLEDRGRRTPDRRHPAPGRHGHGDHTRRRLPGAARRPQADPAIARDEDRKRPPPAGLRPCPAKRRAMTGKTTYGRKPADDTKNNRLPHNRTLKTASAYDAMNRHRNSPVAHRIGPPTRNIRFNRTPNKPIIL